MAYYAAVKMNKLQLHAPHKAESQEHNEGREQVTRENKEKIPDMVPFILGTGNTKQYVVGVHTVKL